MEISVKLEEITGYSQEQLDSKMKEITTLLEKASSLTEELTLGKKYLAIEIADVT